MAWRAIYRQRWGSKLRQARVIQKPYNIPSGDVGGLLNFTRLPRAVEGIMPSGGPDRWMGELNAGTINIGGYEAVGPPEVTLTVGTGDLTRGWG